jgi:hypothetical protein
MKHRKQFLTGWLAALCCSVAAAVLPAAADDAHRPTVSSPSVPLSVFNQPTTPKEGRDPFFPSSTRLFAYMVIPKSNSNDLSSLVIRGKSGSSDHPLVIINDITFAVGDERDVITPQGRVRIHCLQIVGDLAVIEANGQHHDLRFEMKP